jgi:hypothetical protein
MAIKGFYTRLFIATVLTIPFSFIPGSSQAQKVTGTKSVNPHHLPATLKLISAHRGPVIDAQNADVISSGNHSGFETGQVIKIGETYHMFINEMFQRPHRDMRIAYWTSPDAIHWKRQSTIVNSIPGRTATNPRSEVWVTGVEYNHDEDAWNIFYVAYRAGDSTKGEIAGNDYAGRIWRAKSVINGTKGIAGPYADMGIVMEPDQDSQKWEGQQAVACFNPYKVGNTWLAMYDGHNHTPRGPWPTGIAFAHKLEGPWTRMPEGFNPIGVAKEFMENEVVSRLKDHRYLMVFDSFGDQEIGYSISDDGIHWSDEKRIKVQVKGDLWAEKGDHSTRTPLCAIQEADGTFTVIYTAMTMRNNKKFFAVGQCKLAWE